MERTYTRFEVGERNYPELSAHLMQQLEKVIPSVSASLRYFPCCVKLKDGQIIDRVYVVEAQPYITCWGIWPDQDPDKKEVRLEDIADIYESSSRLPARFANEIYEAGESGMGYTVFTIRFNDGTEKAYVAGNAVDFISLPIGQTVIDIVEVIPHEGRERAVADSVPYYWCIHGSGKPRGGGGKH